jgi:uncharacterized protein (DUF1684 family)
MGKVLKFIVARSVVASFLVASSVVTSFLVSSFLVSSCAPKEKPTEQERADHKKDVDAWFDHRVEELKSHDGWLNLAGLYWLNDGMNSFGSDESNDVIFPAGKIAPKAGYFLVKGQQVTMVGEQKEQVIFHPDSSKAITVNQGSLEWFIIRRDNKLGVRLRDLESNNLKNFKGIERYPTEYSWNIPASFEPATAGKTIDITNVLGQTTAVPLAGTYIFEIEGTEYRLDATGDGKQLFVVFGDATNGKETYPAGKFIYIDRPDSTGHVFIDFNKSYNPPCAFTEFATCPLPTKQNILPIAITAGEKNYELHGK